MPAPRVAESVAQLAEVEVASLLEGAGLAQHVSLLCDNGYGDLEHLKEECRHNRLGPQLAIDLSLPAAEAKAIAAAVHREVMADAARDGLHLSDATATGFKGVYAKGTRFRSEIAGTDGCKKYLGNFDTAVEAARAYAQALRTKQQERVEAAEAPEPSGLALSEKDAGSVAKGRGKRRDSETALQRRRRQAKAAVGKDVELYWRGEKRWFKGTVVETDAEGEGAGFVKDEGAPPWSSQA